MLFGLRKILDWKEKREKAAHIDRLVTERRVRELEIRVRRLAAAQWSLPEIPPADDSAALIGEPAPWSRFAERLRRREENARARLAALRQELEREMGAPRAIRAFTRVTR
jgi:hypothetical protein